MAYRGKTHVGTPYRSVRHVHTHNETVHEVPERAVEESLHAQPKPERVLERGHVVARQGPIKESPPSEAEDRIVARK